MYCKYNYTDQSAVVYIPNRLLRDCVSNIMEPPYTLVKMQYILTNDHQLMQLTIIFHSQFSIVDGSTIRFDYFNSQFSHWVGSLVAGSIPNPYFLMVNLMKIP